MEVVPPRGIRRLGTSVLGHPLMRWVGVYKAARVDLPYVSYFILTILIISPYRPHNSYNLLTYIY